MATAQGATMEIQYRHRLQQHAAQSAIYSAAVVSGDYTLRRHGATKTDVITADMFLMVKQVTDKMTYLKLEILFSSF